MRAAARGGPPAAAIKKARAALSTIADLPPTGAALAFVLQGGFASLAFTTTTNAAHLRESLGAAHYPLNEAAVARLSALALDPARGRP
jgi:aryl-alcohol dehydrogenase-like predicted oxidoreductase